MNEVSLFYRVARRSGELLPTPRGQPSPPLLPRPTSRSARKPARAPEAHVCADRKHRPVDVTNEGRFTYTAGRVYTMRQCTPRKVRAHFHRPVYAAHTTGYCLGTSECDGFCFLKRFSNPPCCHVYILFPRARRYTLYYCTTCKSMKHSLLNCLVRSLARETRPPEASAPAFLSPVGGTAARGIRRKMKEDNVVQGEEGRGGRGEEGGGGEEGGARREGGGQ